MGLRDAKSLLIEKMKRLVDGTGFTYRYSQVSYAIGFIPLRILLGGILYISYFFRKMYNLVAGRIEFSYLEIFITTRCTLRCRDCSVFIPYLDKLEDFNADNALDDLGKLLSAVDHIHKIGILGGEAMLHKDFLRVFDFVAGNNKVGSIRIVTNGTFIPGDDILDALASSPKVYMNISEYPLTDEGKRNGLMSALRQRNIKFTVYREMEWYDLGNPRGPGSDEKTARRRFRYCWMKRCNGIRDGRLYMCGRSAFLPMVRDIENQESDSLNLRDMPGGKDGKRILKTFMRKDSLTACAYCNGTYDSPRVPPAVQVKITEV